MYYYKFNIGDFDKSTRHLSIMERGLFRDMLDLYIKDEKPITSDLKKLERLLCVKSKAEKQALQNVLDDFFVLTDDGYFCDYCQSILDETADRAETARENGKKGGRPPKLSKDEADDNQSNSDNKADENPEKTQRKPNENPKENYPIPITHKPNTHNPIKNKYAEQVGEVFEFWKDIFDKKDSTILSDKRKDKIIARLKDGYTTEQIRQAIYNCSKSEFHTSNNHTDLELICRSVEKMDYFLGLKPPQPKQTAKVFDEFGNVVTTPHEPHPNSTEAYAIRLQRDAENLKKRLYGESV